MLYDVVCEVGVLFVMVFCVFNGFECKVVELFCECVEVVVVKLGYIVNVLV